MTTPEVRYLSAEEDSARWLDFEFRDGDIVISTRSKSGTTWMQMICALLVFRSPDLPEPLSRLSPWLDWLALPEDRMFADLAAQKHRRIIKTHTPLDGLPLDDRATFIVVARHPLDAAVSLYHQSQNINRERRAELTGNPEKARSWERPGLDEWLQRWIESDSAPADELDSFNGVFHHLSDAWTRRGEPNVMLVHYADLLDDLNAEMRRIAGGLGIAVSGELIDVLAPAAGFERMRADADNLVPDSMGILKDASMFFRRGSSGAGVDCLNAESVADYLARAARVAPPDLLAWLHR